MHDDNIPYVYQRKTVKKSGKTFIVRDSKGQAALVNVPLFEMFKSFEQLFNGNLDVPNVDFVPNPPLDEDEERMLKHFTGLYHHSLATLQIILLTLKVGNACF